MFRRGWLERTLRKRIVLHTLDDKSIEGTLWEQTSDGVILRAAVLKGENTAPDVSMAGEVFVPRANVAFAQLDE